MIRLVPRAYGPLVGRKDTFVYIVDAHGPAGVRGIERHIRFVCIAYGPVAARSGTFVHVANAHGPRPVRGIEQHVRLVCIAYGPLAARSDTFMREEVEVDVRREAHECCQGVRQTPLRPRSRWVAA